jgi:hypothetical protein
MNHVIDSDDIYIIDNHRKILTLYGPAEKAKVQNKIK